MYRVRDLDKRCSLRDNSCTVRSGDKYLRGKTMYRATQPAPRMMPMLHEPTWILQASPPIARSLSPELTHLEAMAPKKPSWGV